MLSVTLQVGTDPSGGLSAINHSQTEGCLEEDYGGALGFDPNGLVTFQLIGNCGGSDCEPYVTFVSAGSAYSADLFILALDGMPGEDITFDLLQYLYTSYLIPTSPCDNIATDTPDFPVSGPGGADPTLKIEFGEYAPGEALLPVLAKNENMSNDEVRYLTLNLLVETDNLMYRPDLHNFAITPATQSVEPVPGTDNWRIFVRFDTDTPIPVDAEDMTKLFDIEIRGPENESLAGAADVCMEYGQIRRSAHCRLADISEDCAEIVFLGFEPCDPDDFTVVVSAIEPGTNCAELGVKVALNWENLSNTLDFDRIRIAVEFDLPPGVTIDDRGANTFGCPANPSCNPSGGFTDCIKIDGNRVTFCFFPPTPETVSNGSYFEVLFDAPSNCVNGATVRESMIDVSTYPPGGSECVAKISVETGDFPLCSPLLSGWVKNVNGVYIDDVDVVIGLTVPDVGCPPVSIWPDNGPWSWCACDIEEFRVQPAVRHDDESGWLNGVTTYDLVIIDKHLLSIDPFTSIYQYAAANATTPDNQITNDDKVEIRKLILGITNELPINKSWRYFDENDAGVLPTTLPSGSFTPPAEHITVTPSNTALGFVAVKVGDVFITHNPDIEMRPDGELPLVVQASATKLAAGGLLSLPLRYEGDLPLAAAQFALRFDPSRWEYVGVTVAEVEGIWEHCFNLQNVAGGELRFAWHTALPEEQARKGQAFFRLLLRAKVAAKADTWPLSLDGGHMPCAVFDPGGQRYALRLEARSEDRVPPDGGPAPLTATCFPNPSDGAASLRVSGHDPAGRVLLTVFDAFGLRVLRRELSLPPGIGAVVPLPEAAGWSAGPYIWRLRSGGQVAEGLLLRQ